MFQPNRGTVEWEACKPTQLLGGSVLSTRTVHFSEPGVWVRSIQVCNNDRNKRVKGIQIWGARLTASGTVIADDTQHEKHQRFNCDGGGKSYEEWCYQFHFDEVIILEHELRWSTPTRG